MWGALIGDIIGSRFENENHRSPYFELFNSKCRFTDDTVCTAAVADILEKCWPDNLNEETISDQLRLWCCTYLTRGFGSMFYQWIANGVNRPYGSYGNGALMRVSPVAKFAIKHNLSKEKTLEIANIITKITHNHPQALNAVAAYISVLYDLLKYQKENGKLMEIEDAKNIIVKMFEQYQIPEPLTIDEYRINLNFDLTCNNSLGVACAAIIETNNFEDVMYQIVSAGGDSDTYAAIAGPIAEAMYGITEEMMQNIKPYFRSYDEDIIISLEILYYDGISPVKIDLENK